MNGRRPLGETLGEIAGSALGMTGGELRDAGMVRVTSIDLDLPLDLRLGRDADGPVLIGDLPLFRLRTAFDTEPARLTIRFQAKPLESLA